jgi:hypothetical protein
MDSAGDPVRDSSCRAGNAASMPSCLGKALTCQARNSAAGPARYLLKQAVRPTGLEQA